MIDQQLRHIKEQMLHPLARWMGDSLHPTTVTLVGGGVGIAAALAGGMGAYGVGLVLWGANRLLDGLDGTLARTYGKTSDLGAYLDILTDFVVYALIPVCLTLAAPTSTRWLMLAFLLSTFYINSASWMYLSSLLEKHNRGAAANRELTSVSIPVGLVEGTETVIFYTLFFLLPGYLEWLFAVMSVLVILTIAQRLQWAVQYLD